MSDDETMVKLLARELAKARTGGNVYMDGGHNPLPTEYVKARQFLEPLESQNQALQERAERAERLLQAIAFDDQGKLQAWLQPLYIREPYVTVLVDKATQLLSPTQETDPE